MNIKHGILLILLILVSYILLNSADPRIIIIGGRSGPSTLDPAESWDDASSIYINGLFDTLIKLNGKTFELEPSLAEAWRSPDNGKTWIFKLRRGVKFHDNTSFNADSVLFSFNRQLIKNFPDKYYDFPLFNEIFTMLKKVEKIDDYTISFHLKESFYPFLATLTVDCASIVSPSSVKKWKADFRKHPVGTGPYKFKKWEKGKKIVIEKNNSYWRGIPAIKEYHLIIEPKLEPLLTLFNNQKIDILNSYSISKIISLKNLSWVKISYHPSFSTTFFAFNLEQPALRKINIRRALNYLWNSRILQFVYQDHVLPSNSIFPKGIVKNSERKREYPLSIDTAIKLLKSESLATNLSLDFLILKESQLELQIINIYIKNLRKAGIKVKISRVSQREYEKRISEGNYDLTLSGWTIDYPDAFSILNPLFSEKLKQKGFANLSGGENKNIISLLKKAGLEHNRESRDRIYRKIDRLIQEKALFIPLYQDITILIYNKRIGKTQTRLLGYIDFFLTGQK